MEFFLGFDNDIWKKIQYQVFSLILEGFPVDEDDVEKIEVYLGVTNQITLSLKTGASIEIPDVYFDGIWGMLQWGTPEFHGVE